MDFLENFLDNINININSNELEHTIYEEYENFGYTDKKLFKFHLDFLLENTYDIKLVAPKRKRINQSKFRKEILKKFNNTCIITGGNCEDELEAAHIIPVSDKENYDMDNGLLIVSTIHKTFDNFKWSINPSTMQIVIKPDANVGQIKQYNGKNINIDMNNKLKQNLVWHYQKFMQK